MTSTLELPVALDELLGGTVCHLFPDNGRAARSRCGVPREEQAPHAVFDSQYAPVCAGCGLPRCPACRAASAGPMSRRRRIARFLDRLGLLVFGPNIAEWEPMSQKDLDALIERLARDDR